MRQENKSWFMRGMRDGVPIMLGYAAVSFTLGIAARNAGLTAFQAGLASLLNNASAGEKAGFNVIAANESYFVMALMILIANARYLLMSCALSQKISPRTGLIPRMIIGFEVTDEIFGVAMAVPGMLNPWYIYGVIALALPGWSLGTVFGVIMGNVLPVRVVSALSVGLYGMFVAIIVPPARKSRIIAGLVVISMAASFIMATLPVFSFISPGMRIIVLTVVISAAAAWLFPIKEEGEGLEQEGKQA
ncbi:MAG: AzlC family ABC transporter permease [Eubacteriales bacterium]|nr:AzlC family ABC transporter permease [Eubacteriales bacterium]